MKSLLILLQSFALRIWKAAATKYFLVVLFAGLWMLLFDRYNLVSRHQMEAQIEELKKDQEHYQSGIAELDQEAQQLENDPQAMERYAREHYFMRKAGEDVYVIVEE